MMNRPADIKYCGVDRKKVRNAMPRFNEKNLQHLFNFITRRYTIRKLKDVLKQPAPWTTDEVLQDYRFTNVRREHDRETLWLIKNIANNDQLSYDNKVMNTILFRLFNKKDTMEAMGAPVDFFDSRFHMTLLEMEKGLLKKQEREPKYVFFTGAFNTGGVKNAANKYAYIENYDYDFMPTKVIAMIHGMRGVARKIKKCTSQEEVYLTLKSYPGLGPFLAYQIFVDLTYIPTFPFSENEFTIAGPGCKRGLDAIYSFKDGMNYEEALFFLRDNIDIIFQSRGWNWNPDELFDDLPEMDRHMNIMSLENCHCEISKYIRAKEDTGRPRQKYAASKEPMLW